MKLLFIFCPGSTIDHVRNLIDVHEVHGFTEIPEAGGEGETGRRMGSRAWPGVSSVVITAAPEGKAVELTEALTAFAETCSPDEGIRVYQVPVERVI